MPDKQARLRQRIPRNAKRIAGYTMNVYPAIVFREYPAQQGGGVLPAVELLTHDGYHFAERLEPEQRREQ